MSTKIFCDSCLSEMTNDTLTQATVLVGPRDVLLTVVAEWKNIQVGDVSGPSLHVCSQCKMKGLVNKYGKGWG